jgi:hypothetical protein
VSPAAQNLSKGTENICFKLELNWSIKIREKLNVININNTVVKKKTKNLRFTLYHF